MFHLLAYTGSLGVNANNTDLTAALDQEITQRNNHYTFTEDYNLLAAYYFATSATRANFNIPTWNQYTTQNIWPVNRSVNIPANPQLDWTAERQLPFPMNEEIAVRGSNNLGAATEQSTCFLWITPAGMQWTRNVPPGIGGVPVLEARCPFTTNTITANTWSGLTGLTFEQGLRGGSYAVVGAQFQGAACQAMRFVFPRAPVYKNRRMRPGVLGSQAIGDVPVDFTPFQHFLWGEFGRFATFEPPQVEFWSSAGGAIAVEVRLWVVYLSENQNVDYGGNLPTTAIPNY